ncbi:MAG: thioredoxin family protein [Kiritimatiellae bacterium]|nr:thioredoxin family protein [Kiritimatiellia bacterium]
MKRMLTFLLAALGLALPCLALTGFDADYDAALARAKTSGRPLFVLFTGSDWCIWCQKLEEEVLSQKEFLDFATNTYELVELDYPIVKPQLAAQKKRNQELAKKFKIERHPTVLLLDSAEKVLYTASYERGGAEKWVEGFKKGVAIQPLFDKHLAAFREKAVSVAKRVSKELFEEAEGLPGLPKDDKRKAVERSREIAAKYLPEAAALVNELEAKAVPPELEEEKAKLVADVAQLLKGLEETANLDVDKVLAEMEKAEAEMNEMKEKEREDAAERERRRETWLKDWSENIRTNKTIETCASFRDQKLRPFLLAEMDPNGVATEEERKLFNASIDYIWGDEGFKSFWKRKQLVEVLERTAKKPFCAMVKAFAEKQDHVGPVVAWLEAGAYAGEDMRSVFWTLRNNGSFGDERILERLEKTSVDEWLKLLWRISTEKRAAWKARGGGFANEVTDEGWEGFDKHGDASREAYKRAAELHSYPEASYLISTLGPFEDEMFVSATSAQADFRVFYDNYLWYDCFPRWCGSHEKMKAFAERCYETRRHDTMVPYFYAEALLKMVKDMNVSPEEYFRDHADELDKLIEVALPQIKSRNAMAQVRQIAGAVATLAYYLKKDYANAAKTWRSFWHGTMPSESWDVIDDLSNRWIVWDGISGANSNEFQRLNALYLAGDYEGFVKGIEDLRTRVKFDKGEECYADEHLLSARVKYDFPAGRPIVAKFTKKKTSWLTYNGAWLMNDECAFFPGHSRASGSLEWNVEFPGEFRLELEVCAHGNKPPWTFEIWQKPSDKKLADAAMYPSLVLEFDKGECKAAFGRWKDIYKRKTVGWVTRPCPGGKVKVVLVYKDGKATAFVGDDEKPVIENDEHADLLRIIKSGKLRFSGTYVRLLSAKVSCP